MILSQSLKNHDYENVLRDDDESSFNCFNEIVDETSKSL
jgi:hypothetical protein